MRACQTNGTTVLVVVAKSRRSIDRSIAQAPGSFEWRALRWCRHESRTRVLGHRGLGGDADHAHSVGCRRTILLPHETKCVAFIGDLLISVLSTSNRAHRASFDVWTRWVLSFEAQTSLSVGPTGMFASGFGLAERYDRRLSSRSHLGMGCILATGCSRIGVGFLLRNAAHPMPGAI